MNTLQGIPLPADLFDEPTLVRPREDRAVAATLLHQALSAWRGIVDRRYGFWAREVSYPRHRQALIQFALGKPAQSLEMYAAALPEGDIES
jgi:hypothetical protein